MKEAAMYVLKQILDELDSCSKEVNPDVARAYLHYIGLAMHDGKLETPLLMTTILKARYPSKCDLG